MAPGGRNKLTFFMPEAIASLGLWLEQLLAESTGKEGKGVLPVAGEPIEEPGVYGNDRFFAYITMTGISDSRLEKGVAALAEAGFPVVTIRLDDPFRSGPGILSLGSRNSRSGRLPGHQRLRPAQCSGEQDQHEQAPRSGGREKEAPGRETAFHGEAPEHLRPRGTVRPEGSHPGIFEPGGKRRLHLPSGLPGREHRKR